jgi:hypothetical protein
MVYKDYNSKVLSIIFIMNYWLLREQILHFADSASQQSLQTHLPQEGH